MKALFDTNILIDYLKGDDKARAEIDRYADRLVSVITWMEVLVGARTDDEEDVIELFLRDFKVVDVSRPVSRAAVGIRRTHKIRLPDAIIWATARSESALLVTRNSKDFPRDEPGIRLPY